MLVVFRYAGDGAGVSHRVPNVIDVEAVARNLEHCMRIGYVKRHIIIPVGTADGDFISFSGNKHRRRRR